VRGVIFQGIQIGFQMADHAIGADHLDGMNGMFGGFAGVASGSGGTAATAWLCLSHRACRVQPAAPGR
jgi:hypothetical protein